MTCIVEIGGREAIPARAIPFITGWAMSPDVVASSLAHSADWPGRPDELPSYHLDADGRAWAMLPKEWDGIIAALQALSDTLKAAETVEGASYPLWREQSIGVLPSCCFVWRDEFEEAYRRASKRITYVKERAGERDLNFNPRIPTALSETVFEGFSRESRPEHASKAPTSRKHISEKLVAMNRAAEKFWANADPNDRDTHPTNDVVAAWLVTQDFSSTLAAKAATLIRPEWAPTGRKPEK